MAVTRQSDLPDATSLYIIEPGRETSGNHTSVILDQSTETVPELQPKHGRKISVISQAESPDGTTTVLVVDKEPEISFWKNRRPLIIGLAILAWSTATGVSDQQLSKEVNSATFKAPFFFLWYMGFIRSFIFLVYLPIRLIYDAMKERSVTYDLASCPSQKSQTTAFRKIANASRNIYREAATVFGPEGLTLKSGAVRLIPFALLWTSTNGLFYFAVTFAEVSECVTIGSSFIIIVYVISWIFLKEQFLLFKLAGVSVCMGGVVLTAWASGTSIDGSSDSVIAALLTTASSVSLAVQVVGFKKYLGSPTACQIALFQSLASLTNIFLTWPLFLSLKLTGEEVWDFASAPFGIMNASGFIGASGSIVYYMGVSIVSPVFISLARPLQILSNNAIDIGVKGLSFGLYHIIGAGLVIGGFIMLLIPSTLVDFQIRAFIVRIRPGRRPTVERIELELDTDAAVATMQQP